MTQPPLAEQLPYHRLARLAPRHRWWRPLLGTLVVAVGYVLAVLVLMLCFLVLGVALGYPEDADGWPEFGPVSGTALDLLSIAVGIPVLLLTVRWIGRRPAGTVSSVTGRLRWRWLGLCVLTAVPVLALAMGAMVLLPSDGGEAESQWVGWPAFGRALAMLVVLVPLQAAAEEYVFRGWLTQTAGAFLRSPWAALVPQAVLFAAAHGWGTVWGFADLLVFGVCAGWLTWRTGGLEASIALHTVNNLLAFGVSAAVVDGLASDETAADAGWQTVVLDVAGIVLYTAAVTWWLRRRRLDRTAPAPLPPAHPYGVAPGQWPVHPYGPVPGQWPAHPYGSVPGPSPVHPYGVTPGQGVMPGQGVVPGQWPGHPSTGAPVSPSGTAHPGAAAPWPGTDRPAGPGGTGEDTPGTG
ncbi:CPBP family intramembrane glutamic endopeptidase [Streptomyces lavenduligriseus]|uniref:CPBP family glutamic-type intramembrane protease n=1 Tax=Streptomyces lavenduligriseus TaxID=67315 RepID=A0ABT0P271_9ACTN|nr:CPBP family glutamic-type intramembrane protease [Streptomyces lavenduligriseus]MCL3997847.1 CPBP family glutamic-type intramembrane protease [Streptomyces lavenduligriseus]